MTTRTLTLTEDAIRQYSRRGNYHSDADTAAELGLPGLIAQGVQVAGPAYGLLLEAWGDAFLDAGEIDVRFVGPVFAEERVEASVASEVGGLATVEVTNTSTGRIAVVGTARRSAT